MSGANDGSVRTIDHTALMMDPSFAQTSIVQVLSIFACTIDRSVAGTACAVFHLYCHLNGKFCVKL